MLRRGIIGAALLLYLVVLGCVLYPRRTAGESRAGGGDNSDAAAATTRASAATIRAGMPFRGAAIQIQRVDWVEKYKKNIDEIADLGADTVSLVVDSRQENGKSTRIYLDMRMTPSPEQLGEIIRHAKGRKLRVLLMPIVLLDDPVGTEWRGSITPQQDGQSGWDAWFESYRAMITHFAVLARQNGVDILSVGSELVTAERKADEWTKTIRAVRASFPGLITYSANWDHYTSVPFWDQLDLISTNSYYKLGDDENVGVDEIVSRWHDIQKDLLAFTRGKGKPLLFTEVGWCSLQNAAHEPWDYTRTDLPVDLELQKKLWTGFFQAWQGNPDFGGFMVWEWPPTDGGPDDKGYIPKGKPAEAVIREWFAKPKWEVR